MIHKGIVITSAKELVFSYVNFCLLGCQQDYTKNTEQISMNLGWVSAREDLYNRTDHSFLPFFNILKLFFFFFLTFFVNFSGNYAWIY